VYDGTLSTIESVKIKITEEKYQNYQRSVGYEIALAITEDST
jgi:hypothetical protein